MRSLLTAISMFVLVAVGGAIGLLVYIATNQQPHTIVTEVKQPVQVHRELIVFGGPWCKPCVEMRVTVDKVRHNFQVTEIDPQVEQNEGHEWSITDCPTFIAVDRIEGHFREVARWAGKLSEEELDRLVRLGEVPHHEPTQVLPSPSHEEDHLSPLSPAETDRIVHEKRSGEDKPKPPKKSKPKSCPCTFTRPNYWRVR